MEKVFGAYTTHARDEQLKPAICQATASFRSTSQNSGRQTYLIHYNTNIVKVEHWQLLGVKLSLGYSRY